MDTYLSVQNFVTSRNGNNVINKILVANNGMAAVKAIRSIRRWAYETFGNERAIQFIAMSTPEDLQMNAEYIRMADDFIEVPGGSSHNNYSNVDLIVDLAERVSANAVWVGWGFASENPVLAERLALLHPKVVFIGPPPSAMRALGDKIAATIVAQSANVPCVEWSGSNIVLGDNESVVPPELFERATVKTSQEGLKIASRIGYPLMIKASEGGGGKGIRLVYEPESFSAFFTQVQREVPGSPIFIMQVVQNSRHLEVQLLGDTYGNAIALFSRDCSVQRRHQKIIEEAPVTIAPPHVVAAMEESAVNLAKLVGYCSAGTVEYLYEPSKGKYYFLELNPRLQVEHPTTEMVSGVNIPAAQLQVAMGISLSNISDIRLLYGLSPKGQTPIDFEFKLPESFQIQRVPMPRGHVIATRITAEDPDAGFKPNSGRFMDLNFKSNSNVWGYFSVNSSGGVHEYGDSQFGHLFAYGGTRENARNSLIVALKEISIRGDFRNTVEYLIKLLEHPQFQSNKFTTSWMDELIKSGPPAADASNSKINIGPAVCGATIISSRFFLKDNSSFMSSIEKGNVPHMGLLKTKYNVEFILNNISYKFEVRFSGPESLAISIHDKTVKVYAKSLADDGVLVQFGNASHIVYMKEDVTGDINLTVNSANFLLEKEKDPSQFVSPSPGKLIRYIVPDGHHVSVGDAYAEVEVMKMYMNLTASAAGVFTSTKIAGTILSKGDIVGVLALDDLDSIKRSTPFDGDFPENYRVLEDDEKPHYRFKNAKKIIANIMLGFESEISNELLLKNLEVCLTSPELASYELAEALGPISSRIPSELGTFMHDVTSKSKISGSSLNFEVIDAKIKEALESVPVNEKAAMEDLLAPIRNIIDSNRNSAGLSRLETELLAIIRDFANIETLFEVGSPTGVLFNLRDQYKDRLEVVRDIARAALQSNNRINFVISVLEKLELQTDTKHREIYLREIDTIANLTRPANSKAAFKARQISVHFKTPDIDNRLRSLLSVFDKTLKKYSTNSRIFFNFAQLSKDVAANHTTALLDILPALFFHSDNHISGLAQYTYVMRTNMSYNTILSFDHVFLNGSVVIYWEFVRMKQSTFKIMDDPLSPHISGSKNISKRGILFNTESLDNLSAEISLVFNECQKEPLPKSVHLTIALNRCSELDDDDIAAQKILEFVEMNQSLLIEFHVSVITFMILIKNSHSRYFTFSKKLKFKEDLLIRHIEPNMAHRLEMTRLKNFNITTCSQENPSFRIYSARGKENPTDLRFFVRGIIYPTNMSSFDDFFITEGNRIISGILDSLELLIVKEPYTDCNHILLHFLPKFELSSEKANIYVDQLIRYHRLRLAKLMVTEIEIMFVGYDFITQNSIPLRGVITITPFLHEIIWYREDEVTQGRYILVSIGSPKGSLDGQPVFRPHSLKHSIQPKRYRAHLLGTAYIYDFPSLFEEALKLNWRSRSGKVPSNLIECVELVLNSKGILEETSRDNGLNDSGMVAFKMTLKSPEYPTGRTVIVIGNDITFKIGSFGPKESELYLKASRLARRLRIPRIYISANSGARIGLAEEVISKFKISWINESDPLKGFEYIYLTKEDFEDLNADPENPSVIATQISHEQGVRYKLEAIIGLENGLGVENLVGSGRIAGETSLAYQEIFTITLVTCRSVGIGAYLARLGQRVVQVNFSPIILTGANALNKVLGSHVYTSNLQLGGTRVMHHNGVSHLVAENDFDGIRKILDWLSFVPCHIDNELPIVEIKDKVGRLVDVALPTAQYDPRILMTGCYDEKGEWQNGFFDYESFQETLTGWAAGVVVGRARLGGIPIGVICVKTLTTDTITYADPALPDSRENLTKEAGQVLYPHSSFKMAQAIRDFNQGEQLPLIIFANWRGFSGGQSDMSKEILKFGAYIVDSLQQFQQPIFVYNIGELRGGAWVVVDSAINPEMMESYASENARGGVLEPQGVVEIRYRKPKILSTIERLDESYKRLSGSLLSSPAAIGSPANQDLRSHIIDEGEKLFPIYEQVAVHLADLHDKPDRMVAKKAIKKMVPWAESRAFFYQRLARRLKEQYYHRILKSDGYPISLTNTALKLYSWFRESGRETFNEDQDFVQWCTEEEKGIMKRIITIKKEHIINQMVHLEKKLTGM